MKLLFWLVSLAFGIFLAILVAEIPESAPWIAGFIYGIGSYLLYCDLFRSKD